MFQQINVTRPSLPSFEEYTEAIRPLWETHWLTNMGYYHKQLEDELKLFLGVPFVSLMVNGHMSLELLIQAMNFPDGGEVITTPLTFISTTHAILRNNLVPIFCDVKKQDGTIDENKIEELISDHTVAILPVHVYGNICNVDAIDKITKKYGLKVIYDAAHAFGESFNDVKVGQFGDASIFSFHATKVFHTIEGGAVVSNNKSLIDKLYNLKNFGIHSEESIVDIGANAKMNEFCAIMGLCNLKHFEEAVQYRKKCTEIYFSELQEVCGISFFCDDVRIHRNYGYFPILVNDDYPLTRDELYNLLRTHQINTRKYFYPLTSDMEFCHGKYENLPLFNARKIAKAVLLLPLYEGLEFKEVHRIIQLISNH